MNVLTRRAAARCLFLASCSASLALVSAPSLRAQAVRSGPPNVLLVQREYLKPGRTGSIHERSESAFVNAMRAANYPTHYFALDSLSGASRSLFLIPYDSFAAWEADNKMMRADKTLSAAFDKASLADGDLLASYDSTVLMLRKDMSLNPMGITGVRYFEISTFLVKPGHQHEWDELVKLYKEGYAKVPGAHWDVFEQIYGAVSPTMPSGTTYVVLTLLKSLAETDRSDADSRMFAENLGAGNMKKLGELSAACLQGNGTNLFEINPRMSYPPREWITAEPDFWKSPATAAHKPAARKPAAASAGAAPSAQ